MSTVPLGVTLTAPEGPAFELLVVFLCVVFGPPLVAKARIPGIIALLLGGFLIGPHGLDLIPAGSVLIPEVGKVGLLYLMFVAGVELDLALLRLHRRTAIGFGLLTFSAPMLFGALAGELLGFSFAASLLLGSLLASHTLLLYPLVRERGLAGEPAIASAVGATVLTDTLALIVLAAVAGSETSGGGFGSIVLQIGGGLVVLLLVTLVGLPQIARRTFATVGRHRTERYLLVFSLFLFAAVVSEVFGIEGIVGAFFAGLALNRFVPNHGPLMSRIDFFGSAVFVPVFLVSVGLLLDPEVMVQGETLKYAAYFCAACVGGKALAAALAKAAFRFPPGQTTLVFALTTPQAAATLAATIVGYDIGLFTETVVNAVLVLILVSVVLSTIVAERAAARVPAGGGERLALGERVLVVVQDAAAAATACRLAARIARDDGGLVLPVLLAGTRTHGGQKALAELQRVVDDIGVDAECAMDVSSRPAEAVLDLAAAREASLVLVAESPGRVPGSPAFGSWPEAVAGSCPAPVLIVRGEAAGYREVRLGFERDIDPQAPAPRLAREIGERLGGDRPTVTPVADITGEHLLVIAPVETWEDFDRYEPPVGAGLVLVPAPTIPRDPEQA